MYFKDEEIVHAIRKRVGMCPGTSTIIRKPILGWAFVLAGLCFQQPLKNKPLHIILSELIFKIAYLIPGNLMCYTLILEYFG